MRLEPEQICEIHWVLSTYWKKIPYRLFLYGSRVHDHLRGGDIDLLILTNDEGVKLFQEQELSLLVELKRQPTIGERRIDIKAVTESSITTSPFLKHISQEMTELLRQ